MAEVADFPKQVIIALAQSIKYLSAFRVADALLAANFFSKFTTKAHMLLNGNTITNLCVCTRCDGDGNLNRVLQRDLSKRNGLYEQRIFDMDSG